MENLNEIISKFKGETGYSLSVKEGKPYYNGTLYLSHTPISSLPDNLVVRGGLDLRYTPISSLPDKLVARGGKVNRNIPSLLKWRGGEYIKADGIFSKVISHKGNLYKVCQIGKNRELYLVTDGNGKYSHGRTVKEAREDLIYKTASRDKSAYADLTLESELSFAESVEAYRVITGACSEGTKMFVENDLTERKAKYTISDIIRLTEGRYNSEVFKDFFKK